MIEKKQLDYPTLIRREKRLVQQGNFAQPLAKIFKQYQFAATRNVNFTVEDLIVYFSALILSHEFLELKFAVRRNRGVHSNVINQAGDIAQNAISQNYKDLLQISDVFIQEISTAEPQIADKIKPQIKSYILKKLSRNYRNFPTKLLLQQYQIIPQDLQNYKIEQGYVYFEYEQKVERLDQTMHARIIQLSTITENIVQNDDVVQTKSQKSGTFRF